jgi:hypothetical protein
VPGIEQPPVNFLSFLHAGGKDFVEASPRVPVTVFEQPQLERMNAQRGNRGPETELVRTVFFMQSANVIDGRPTPAEYARRNAANRSELACGLTER